MTFLGSGYTVGTSRSGTMTVNSFIDNQATSGTNTILLDVLINQTINVSTSGGGTLQMSGTISSFDPNARFIKKGTGELLMDADNQNYDGQFRIDAGLVTAGSDDALGTGSLSLGGTLQANRSVVLNNQFYETFFATISGDHDITMTGTGFINDLDIAHSSGIVNLTGDLTSAGSSGRLNVRSGSGSFVNLFGNNTKLFTRLENGTLGVGSDTALGENLFTMAGGALRSVNAASTVTLANDFVVASNSEITGDQDLKLMGSGTLSGRLDFTNSGASDVMLAGNIAGSGSFRIRGSGHVRLSGTNDPQDGTILESGVLEIGNNAALGETRQLNLRGGMLVTTQTAELLNPFKVEGTPMLGGMNDFILTGNGDLGLGSELQVANPEGTIFLRGVLSGQGGLKRLSGGTLWLAGGAANTYTGVTRISGGTLNLVKPAGIAAFGGPLEIGDGTSVGTVRLAAANQIPESSPIMVKNGSILDLNNFPEAVGAMTLIAGQVQTGTATLTLMGDVTANAAAAASVLRGTVALGGGGTRTINTADGGAAVDLMLDAILLGGSGLRKLGAGTALLSANNTYTGQTLIDAGTLVINGTQKSNTVQVNANGTLQGTGSVGPVNVAGGRFAPGQSPGQFIVNGDITFSASSTLILDIDAFVPGVGFDQVQVVNGRIFLNGAQLQMTMRAGFAPGLASAFKVMDNPTNQPIVGTFANLAEGGVVTVNGLTFQVTYVGGAGNDIVMVRGVRTGATLTVAVNPVPPGETASLTVQIVAPPIIPAGEVRLEENGVSLGRATLDETGRATFRPVLSPGLHQLLIVFEATTNFFAANSQPLAVTIPDPPQADQIQLTSASFEVAESAGSLTITITRTGTGTRTVTAQFTTGNITAEAGPDFTATSGMVTFGPGETSKTVSIPIVNDQLVEEDQENFGFVLSNPAGGATLGAPLGATIVIRDDDLPQIADSAPPANIAAAAIVFAKSTEHYRDFVTKAYSRFLKRQPDEQGLQFWVVSMRDFGLTQEQLEAGFLVSQEYTSLFGGIGEGWIRGIYNDLLSREGDVPGIEFWKARLAEGVAPTQVALGFTASLERQRNRIQETYRRLLGREAEQAGLDFWVNFFQRGGTNEDIEAGFVGSQEYYANPTKGANNAAKWVRRAYADVLFRQAAAGEMTFWMQALGKA